MKKKKINIFALCMALILSISLFEPIIADASESSDYVTVFLDMSFNLKSKYIESYEEYYYVDNETVTMKENISSFLSQYLTYGHTYELDLVNKSEFGTPNIYFNTTTHGELDFSQQEEYPSKLNFIEQGIWGDYYNFTFLKDTYYYVYMDVIYSQLLKGSPFNDGYYLSGYLCCDVTYTVELIFKDVTDLNDSGSDDSGDSGSDDSGDSDSDDGGTADSIGIEDYLSRTLFNTPLEEYTVNEGLLLCMFLVLLASFINKIFKGSHWFGKL